MNVSLISITQPFLSDLKNPEDIIAYCARVSNPNNQLNTETARAIAAQILRHRSFSFQEFSQRYSQAQVLEKLELRKQAAKNRQSSTDEYQNSILQAKVREHVAKGISLYNNLIEDGVAKESARMILPLTVETTMYMKGSIRSWAHYIDLRIEENTQKEHREIAEACKEIFKQNLPTVSEALWN